MLFFQAEWRNNMSQRKDEAPDIPEKCMRHRDRFRDAIAQLADPSLQPEDLYEVTLFYLAQWKKHCTKCAECRRYGERKKQTIARMVF